MTFNEYQQRAHALAFYPKEQGLMYTVLKLAGEAGEVAEKLGKAIRDGEPKDFRGQMAKELGDVLWYVQEIGLHMEYTLEELAVLNITKLEDRQVRGVLGGSGDNR